jgi:primosomal protein N'
VSPVRYFDAAMLELLRWVSERYVAPLATLIGRAVPPRVASEEEAVGGGYVTEEEFDAIVDPRKMLGPD